MRRMWLLFLGILVGLLVLVACAKAAPTATPTPPTATPIPPTSTPLPPGVTPTATPVPPPPTPTLSPGQIPFTFPKGEAAPGLYKTYEEALKDWPNVVAAAKKEGKVLYATAAPPAPGTSTYLITKAFTDKYGIQVEYTGGGRGPEIYAKLQAEKAARRYTMDIYPTGPTFIRPACAGGFCVSFVTPNALEPGVPWLVNPLIEGVHLALPELGGRPPGGQVVYWQRNSTLVNTKREPDPAKWPKKFADLEASYWKGKVAMEDIRNMGPIADYFDYATRPEGVALGLGERHLQALIKNLARLYVGSGPTAEAVIKGDQAIAPMIPTSALLQYTRMPKPWEWEVLTMGEGEMGWVISCGILTNAPNPNAARLMCDFLTSKEADEIRGSQWGAGVGRKDTKVVWPGVVPAKVFPVDYGDPKFTMEYTPTLVRGKVTQWLADAGF